MIYLLGREWFGRAAGALAAADLPHARAGALLRRARLRGHPLPAGGAGGAAGRDPRRRRAGAPVLVLLALAGLLRPEAWAFSGLYLVYLVAAERSPALRRLTGHGPRLGAGRRRPRGAQPRPARAGGLWRCWRRARRWCGWRSDLAITGDPLWSLTNTRHTASTLQRVTGIANVPRVHPADGSARCCARRCSLGAAVGGVLALLWLRAAGGPGGRRGRDRGGRVRGLRLGRAADQHALRASSPRRSCASSAGPACSAGNCSSAGTRTGACGRSRRWSSRSALVAYAPASVGSAHRELRQTRAASTASKTNSWRSSNGHAIDARVRAGGGAQPRAGPAARAVSEDQPGARSCRPRPARSSRGTYLAASPASGRATTCSTSTTRTPPRGVPPRASPRCAPNRSWTVFERCRAMSGPCTPLRDGRAPGACPRQRLRSGSSRCAWR